MANKPHKSVGNERDELFALLKEASFTYRKEVIGESKLYELYVEDFLNGHYYSDHRDAAGKNRHRKNIGILRGILTKRKDLVGLFFSNILFAPNRMDELLRLFNTTKASSGLKEEPDKPRPETNLPALSLGSFLNDNQLSLIAHCANEAQLFTTPVNAGILRSLLEGTLHQPLKSANNRLVAFFFDRLCHHRLILGRWEHLLEQAGSILGSKDGRPLKHGQYSSALSLAKSNPNSMQEVISQCVQAVREMTERNTTDNK